MSESIALEGEALASSLVDKSAQPGKSSPPGALLASLRSRLPAWEAVAVWAVLFLAWQGSTYFIDQNANPLLPGPRIVAEALWESLPELCSDRQYAAM